MKAKQTILLGGVACGTLAILGGLFAPELYYRSASAVTENWTEGGTYSGRVTAGEHDGRMYNDGTMEVEFTFDSSLEMKLDGKTIEINGLTPGQSATSTKPLTITTTTNNINGYTLSAMVDQAGEGGTTALKTEGGAELASMTSPSALPTSGDSVWGWSVDDDTNYSGFSKPGVNVELKKYTQAAIGGHPVKFNIGAYASQGQPSGKYTNTITFTSTVNVVTEP